MEKSKVPFNYFYQLFIEKYKNYVQDINKNRIDQIEDRLISIFNIQYPLTSVERLSIYNKSLFDVCSEYISLSNCDITVMPNDPLELVDLILEKTKDNPYQESFLLSLQFIYQNYFEVLDKGSPILMSTNDDYLESMLKVTQDSNNQLVEFDSINLEFIDQDKIMTKILSMEISNQQGPIPKVGYRIRKDI